MLKIGDGSQIHFAGRISTPLSQTVSPNSVSHHELGLTITKERARILEIAESKREKKAEATVCQRRLSSHGSNSDRKTHPEHSGDSNKKKTHAGHSRNADKKKKTFVVEAQSSQGIAYNVEFPRLDW